MATNFPASLDTLTNPSATDTLDSPPHDTQHADANDAIEALQAKVGVDGSAVTTSIDYQLNTGYRYHSTVYFTSSGSFTKASYPWLRAVKVIVQGGGGGGGGVQAPTTTIQGAAGAGGSGGGWAQTFITDIAGMASSVTVTVGAGGSGGAAGGNDGAAGGSSSFGTDAVAEGGGYGKGGAATSAGNLDIVAGTPGGVGTTGDVVGGGQPGGFGFVVDPGVFLGQQPGHGGSSRYGNGGEAYIGGVSSFSAAGGNAEGNGAGGAGAYMRRGGGSAPTAQAGGDGSGGIVIVELYA